MNRTEKRDMTIFGFLMIIAGLFITVIIGIDAYWHYFSQTYTYQLNGAGVAGIVVAILGGVLFLFGLITGDRPDVPFTYSPPPQAYYQNIPPLQPMQTTCPVCGQIFKAEFLSCPRCGTQLKMHCTNCGQQIDTRAMVCPYCNASTKT